MEAPDVESSARAVNSGERQSPGSLNEPPSLNPVHFLASQIAVALLALVSPASAQDIEPRAYSNAPIGFNFLIGGLAYTRGGLAFDPSLPVSNPDLHTSSAVMGYARVIEIGGQSAKVDVIVPYTALSGTADYRGERVSRDIHGFSNPSFRLSANFYGAPALSAKEFAGWRQDTIVGASLRISTPWAQYDDDRLVNIGTNRWSFKPELGVSKTWDAWTIEGAAGVTFFTDNTEFFGGRTRSQKPLYSAQGHLIYGFRNGMWASFDGTWFAGGRTTINGTLNTDLQQNWRAGATFSVPLQRSTSVKFYASSGLSARTGNSYDLIGAALQYRWLDSQ